MIATEVTELDFTEQVEERAMPILLDFYAGWCGPCQKQSRILQEFPPNGWKLCKIDIDHCPALARRYQVYSVPTLVFLQGGEVKKQVVGVQDEAALIDIFRELA